MGPKAQQLEAARRAGRCAYHDFARWMQQLSGWGAYGGTDVQAYALRAFDDHSADYSARLAAFVEPAFRASFESEAGKYVDEMDITLSPLTAAAAELVVSAAPSPISGVVSTHARHQLALRMEG